MVRRSGVLASIGASVLFGVTFLLPPRLEPLDAEHILAYRILFTIPILVGLTLCVGAWPDVVRILRRCRSRPYLLPVLIVDAALLGVQLWLFGWGPRTGHGLEVSLGYLILPLVMVVISVAVYRERFSAYRAAASLTAALGVAAAIIFGGGVGWPTLVVAAGFPIYFVLRRRSGLNTTGALLLELVAMLPFSAAVLLAAPSPAVTSGGPRLLLGLTVLGLVSAAGFTLYLTASRILPFALFGVLSYLEPVLLVLVSLFALGESLSWVDAFTYVPICLALTILALEARTSRSASPDMEPDPEPDAEREATALHP